MNSNKLKHPPGFTGTEAELWHAFIEGIERHVSPEEVHLGEDYITLSKVHIVLCIRFPKLTERADITSPSRRFIAGVWNAPLAYSQDQHLCLVSRIEGDAYTLSDDEWHVRTIIWAREKGEQFATIILPALQTIGNTKTIHHV